MTTFNFTVRAVDERGAYADRDFSIKVRNTIIDRYIAMSTNGHLYTSPDGDIWTQRINEGIALVDNNYMYSNEIVYGNGIWVAVLDRLSYQTSTNGVLWTRRTLPATIVPNPANYMTAINTIPKVSFVNGKFYIARWTKRSANNYHYKEVWSSLNGIDWEFAFRLPVNSEIIPNNVALGWQQLNSICFGNGTIIMSSGLNTDVIYVSKDNGENWITANCKVTNILNIYYYNGLFFALSTFSMGITTSIDGLNWTIQPVPAIANVGYSQLMYGNGRLIALATRGSTSANSTPNIDFFMTSTDGVNWEKIQLPVSSILAGNTNLNKAMGVYFNGVFMILYNRMPGSPENIGLRSTDAVNWEPIPISSFVGLTDNIATGNVGFHSFGAIGQD